MIAAMCIKWSLKCILIVKKFLNAAYRCVHANAQIASICIAIVGKLVFLCLCLSFGTTTAPKEYTTISEAATNLGNDIIADTSCNTTNLQLLHRHLLPRKYYLSASDPLVRADHWQ